MLRELVSADVLEGVPLEGRDDEAAASGAGRGPAIPPAMVLEPPPCRTRHACCSWC